MASILIPGDKWDAIFGMAKSKRNITTTVKRKPGSRKDAAKTARNGMRIKRPNSRAARAGGVEPGIYHGVPFNEYLAWPFVNNTLLAHAARSLAHFHAAEQSSLDQPTDSMRLGSLIHAGILEPDSLAVMPRFEDQIRRENGSEYANPKATTAYKKRVAEFEAKNTGKRIVAAEEFETIGGIRESLASHQRAAEYLDEGSAEVSIVWDDPASGIRCKGRLDKWNEQERRIVDLKTTRDGSDFDRSIFKYGYHRQAAFYSDGMSILTGHLHEFATVAVETEPPYCVRGAPVSTNTLDAGRKEYKHLLQDIAACRTTGEWPAYEDPECWELPAWSRNEGPLLLSVNGSSIKI